MWTRCVASMAVLLCLPASFAMAQSAGTTPDFTLRTESRVVLTDVTVSDKAGNPIRGLKASDFQILDNSKLQVVSSFAEHSAAEESSREPLEGLMTASAKRGEYSNDFLLHLPLVLNIMVIDTKDLEPDDQAYLAYQLKHFVQHLPPDEPLAIYWCNGPRTVMLQSFTADHGLLLAAVQRAVPHFPPMGREYLTDEETLHQIATDLGQLPGRKNVLWFTGGSTLLLAPETVPPGDQAALRSVLDELESSRIAIYPVDTQGLTVTGGRAMLQQKMRDIAQTTGGQAFYNNNGLDLIASHVLSTDSSFYTLTYTPSDYRFDNKWHSVQVRVSDGRAVTLSYRRGYFADAHDTSSSAKENKRTDAGTKTRRRLLLDGRVVEERLDQRNQPIIFKVSLLPTTAISRKRGMIPYAVTYSLPRDSFTVRQAGDTATIELYASFIAFNNYGTVIAHQADKVTFTMKVSDMQASAAVPLSFLQQVSLPKGNADLYCAVWDTTSRRGGTLEMPITAFEKPVAKTGIR